MPGNTDRKPSSDRDVTTIRTSIHDNRTAGDDEAALADARELINAYPTYPDLDAVIVQAGDMAATLGRNAEAARYYDRAITDYPMTPFRERALLGAAAAYDAIDDPVKSAERLLQLLELPVEADTRKEANDRLGALVVDRLGTADLARLTEMFPKSRFNEEMAVQLARGEFARGNYEDAYNLLAQYIYEFPNGGAIEEARRLMKLASERREAPTSAPETIVKPGHIGVVLPITGKTSLYGRYFELGVEAALAEYNKTAKLPAVARKIDTQGDPITSVKAVRRLTLEDGCVAILGSVFTMPTVAAAIEANAWRVPMLSPVVSASSLSDVGPWIFQTKVPPTIEVSAMAALSASSLRLERVAVIAPVSGERRDLADFFSEEIRRLGVDVVALEYYDNGASDFKAQLEVIRESAPDAIFAPGTIEELLLLIPQIKFYDMQVQLLGLSNWNSEKLLRLSREDLEGALFPLEAFHGKDDAAYERFKTLMGQKDVSEISPISVMGYFGMRMLLAGIAEGAVDRQGMKDYLDKTINRGAAEREAYARELTILTVRSGRVTEFRRPGSGR